MWRSSSPPSARFRGPDSGSQTPRLGAAAVGVERPGAREIMAKLRDKSSTEVDQQVLTGSIRRWYFSMQTAIYGAMLDTVRRFAAILLTLALALGPGMSGAFASPDHGKAVIMMSSDMHSSGKCNDCDGSKAGMPVATCSISCSGITAVSPGTVAAGRLPKTVNGFTAASDMTGRNIPPDPYPPRPTILS